MTQTGTALLADILRRDQQPILNEWVKLQLDSTAARRDLMTEAELTQQSRDFLTAFATDVATRERAVEIADHFTQPGGTVELRPVMWPGGDDR